MTIARPLGMPSTLDRCWGKLFQDGDRECEQCRWNDTCRPKMFEVASAAPIKPPVPSLPMYSAPTPVRSPAVTGAIPIPPRPTAIPTYSPQPTQSTAQVRYTPSAPTPPQPTISQPTYSQYNPPYSNQQGHSIPDPRLPPNPMSPMYRPGAQGPAYYLNQYPGESTAARLTKNMFLRAFEAIFSELSFFFRHWTWPPK